jgi:excisionase family DNA binding protein
MLIVPGRQGGKTVHAGSFRYLQGEKHLEIKNSNDSRSAQPALLKIPQVATDLNVSRTTVYELIRSGKLQTVKIGKSVRVTREGLRRFIDSLTGL